MTFSTILVRKQDFLVRKQILAVMKTIEYFHKYLHGQRFKLKKVKLSLNGVLI